VTPEESPKIYSDLTSILPKDEKEGCPRYVFAIISICLYSG